MQSESVFKPSISFATSSPSLQHLEETPPGCHAFGERITVVGQACVCGGQDRYLAAVWDRGTYRRCSVWSGHCGGSMAAAASSS